MLREIVKSQCGILFEREALQRENINLTMDDTECTELDNKDALAPIYDQLKLNKLWWILELIPLTFSWQDAAGNWKSSFGYVCSKHNVQLWRMEY